MSITLDGQKLFDEQQLRVELGSLCRESIERKVPGLNGVLSIDLGIRSREIRQTGVLRAKSALGMNERIEAISAYVDGSTHKLVTEDGRQFDNLRMDVFKVTGSRSSGSGVVVDYEIIYTQLMT